MAPKTLILQPHQRIIQRLALKVVDTHNTELKAVRWLRMLESAYQIRLDALCGKHAPVRCRPSLFLFHTDPTLNAVATIEDDHGLVAIHDGTVHILVDLFHAMLSRSELFPWIGNPGLEESQFEQIQISDRGIVAGPDRHPSVPRFPARDPERQRFAMMLTQLTLDFVFAHEAAHVVAGHSILFGAAYGTDTALWSRPPRHSIHENSTRKAMEMDADIEAGRRLAYYLANGSSMSLTDSELPTTVGERFFCMCVAVASYFVMVAPESYGKRYWSVSHPHPYARMAYVFSGVADKFVELRKEEWFVMWRSASKSAVEFMERAWVTIGMGSVPLGNYFEEEDRVRAEVGKIHRRWRELVREIRPFDLRQEA